MSWSPAVALHETIEVSVEVATGLRFLVASCIVAQETKRGFVSWITHTRVFLSVILKHKHTIQEYFTLT